MILTTATALICYRIFWKLRFAFTFVVVLSPLCYFFLQREYIGSNNTLKTFHSGNKSTKQTVYASSMCGCNKQIPVKNVAKSGSKFRWCSDESAFRGEHQKTIVYTLYEKEGNDAKEFHRYFSLLTNISLTAAKVYPDWTIRIYHNIVEDENNEAHQEICKVFCSQQNVDLCNINQIAARIGNSSTPIEPHLVTGLNPKMYRYLVMLDPNVDIFISRDVDSLILPREVDAVLQWLSSNYTFHLMRDHKAHGVIILAGMFGVKMYHHREMIESLARAIIVSGRNQYIYHDQQALYDILWPTAKYDVMAHDSYFCQDEALLNTSALKVFPFPTQREGPYYVGAVGAESELVECPLACRPLDHQDWKYC